MTLGTTQVTDIQVTMVNLWSYVAVRWAICNDVYEDSRTQICIDPLQWSAWLDELIESEEPMMARSWMSCTVSQHRFDRERDCIT